MIKGQVGSLRPASGSPVGDPAVETLEFCSSFCAPWLPPSRQSLIMKFIATRETELLPYKPLT